jgi:hypothetical protein
MAITYYSISISPKNLNPIFNGYFSVDTNTNLITGFYDLSLDTNNGYKDVLLPTNDQASWEEANNIFPFDINGLNFYSAALQNFFSINQDHFCIYSDYGRTLLYTDQTGEIVNPEYTIDIVSISSPPPFGDICFPAGTPITTNQGIIPIEKINQNIHTIRNKKIVGITQTITQDKHLICFEKDALGPNIPNQKTIISKNHCIFYKGEMIKAKNFINKFENVKKVIYTGEILYNVLMEEHDKMMVNNLICETLHPENTIAKLYMILQKLNPREKEKLVKYFNEYAINNNLFSSKKSK